ncbi:MAG: hypothetical protein ACRDXF_09130, partial [Acidimicrobiia bacterium]
MATIGLPCQTSGMKGAGGARREVQTRVSSLGAVQGQLPWGSRGHLLIDTEDIFGMVGCWPSDETGHD